MFLKPTIKSDGRLYLDAFSYSSHELNAVAAVLDKYAIPFQLQEIGQDGMGRTGLRHIMPSLGLAKFQEKLSVKIVGNEDETRIIAGPGGAGYRCQQLAAAGVGSGCAEFAAPDDVEAIVRCAAIANLSGWLGGVSSPGRCRGLRERFLGRLFGS